MSYTHLDLGLDFLPYWDDETSDTDNTETETNDINNIELPF